MRPFWLSLLALALLPTLTFAQAPKPKKIVLIAGNLPFKTEVASIHLFHRIEQDPEGSAAVAVVLLLTSFAVLLGIGALRWWVTRHEHG